MAGFHLLNPAGLWLLLGAIPVVLLYVLKVRRARLRVGSTWLWAEARRDLLARSPFRRLLPEVPLVLQLLALAALALALAHPVTRGRVVAGDHVAVVVDVSASMGAVAGPAGATRLREAQAAAHTVVEGLGPGADALVVEAGREARVTGSLTRDAVRLRQAIDALVPLDVEGDLVAAVALAADRLRAAGGKGHLVVITDGALARTDPLPAFGMDLDVVVVGTPQDNAALVRVDVRPGEGSATKRDEVQVFALAKNAGARPREAFVTVTVEEAREPAASRRVLLPAGEKTAVVLSFEPRTEDRGKGLVVQLAPTDALAADDMAFGHVPQARRMPVTLASDATEASWIGRALLADEQVELQRLTLVQLATVNVDPEALVVVEGACPERFPGRDVLVVNPPAGPCLGLTLGAKVPNPAVTSWDEGDPRLRFLTLDGVHVREAKALGGNGPHSALVRGGTTTLLADASTPGRAATVVAFDPRESDWPLKASFVLFVRNVVEWARLHRTQGAAGPARTGEPLRIAVPPEVTSVRVEGPGLSGADVPVRGGFAVVPAPSRAGLYRARWSEPRPGGARLAVNLLSERESDLTQRPVAVDTGGGVRPAEIKALPEAHDDWTRWMALAASLLVGADVLWMIVIAVGARRRGRTSRSDQALALVVAASGLAPALYVAVRSFARLGEGPLRFGHPTALGVLAAAALLYAVAVPRIPMGLGPVRRRGVALLAWASLAAGLTCLAEPELGRPLDRLTSILAVDRSRSIDLVPGAASRVASEIKVAEKSMGGQDRIGTVVFGAEAATEDPPRPRSDLAPAPRVEVGRDGTDLEGALRRALSEVPSETAARVVLITDGVQTRGDALAAAAAAVGADVPVDAVLLEQKPMPNLRVVSVRAPGRASENEALDLRVVTESAVAAEVELRLKRDGQLVRTGRGHVEAGEDVLRVRELAAAPGLHRYDVEITATDPRVDSTAEDNSGTAFVRVRGPSLALVLEGDPGKGAPLGAALESAGFLPEERGAVDVPADVGGLAGYDLVVLSDVRATDLSMTQLAALGAYARDLGGGLILMGGDRSMGPGGYARTPVEDVSPVGFDLKQEKRRASLAEVIVIDDSGSMGAQVDGRTKLDLANEAAARSASLLGPTDRLGVAHVDTSVQWTVPLTPVDDGVALANRIRRVGVGGGGIFTDIALDAAYGTLAREDVNLKHVLLFADGSDAEQIQGCRAKVAAAFSHGITTSVISLGRGGDTPELEALSVVGHGRFYLIEDATRLPAVFAQETVLASKSALHEDPFSVTVGQPGAALKDVDFAGAPALGGYVVTVPKPRATVHLTGPEGDPILASWSVGLGRVAAFTSDYKDRWGSGWLKWPAGSRLVGQLARDVARRGDDPKVRLEADTLGGELHVRADVLGDDGRAQTFRRLVVHVAGPDGFAKEMALEAVGPGRYAARVALSRPGTYVAVARDETTGQPVGTTGAALSAGEELRLSSNGSDRALLERITAMTGGKMRDTLAGLFDDRPKRRFAYAPLTSFLVLVAALGLLAAVGTRRLAVPEGWLRPRTTPGRKAPLAVETGAGRGGGRTREAVTATAVGKVAVEIATRPSARDPSPDAEPSAGGATAPPQAPLTSAEVLARRRRERRG